MVYTLIYLYVIWKLYLIHISYLLGFSARVNGSNLEYLLIDNWCYRLMQFWEGYYSCDEIRDSDNLGNCIVKDERAQNYYRPPVNSPN